MKQIINILLISSILFLSCSDRFNKILTQIDKQKLKAGKEIYKDYYASNNNGSYKKGVLRILKSGTKTVFIENNNWEEVTVFEKNSSIDHIKRLTLYDSLGNIKNESVFVFNRKDSTEFDFEVTELKKRGEKYYNVILIFNDDGRCCGEMWYELVDFNLPKSAKNKTRVYLPDKSKYFDEKGDRTSFEKIKKYIYTYYVPTLSPSIR